MRTYESHHRPPTGWLARATISGFVAIGVSTIALVIVSGVAGALGEAYRESNVVFTWMYELTHNPLVELASASLFASLALQMTFGMFWAIIYALWAQPRLRHTPGWQAGMLFSMLPYALSVVLFLPAAGAGLFGSNLGAGPLPLVGNLLLHLIWGATLGAGYGAGSDRTESVEDVDQQEPYESVRLRGAETGAARGILLGAVAGGAIGVVLGIVFKPASSELLIGSWPVAMGVGGALAGGAVGALIGSLAGLGSGEEFEYEDLPPVTGQPIAAALLPLGVIAVVATLVVSIGSLLLTSAVGMPHEDLHHVGPVTLDGYYTGPILVGLGILTIVIVVAVVLDRAGRGESEHVHP
jgi:hypothetical protein